LPRPVVPADGSELVDADSGPDLLPPDELAERADLARGFLAGLAAACAVTAAAGAVLAATAGGWAGPAFAAVTVVVLGLRARGYADAVPARVAMSAGIAGGVALAGLAADADGTAGTVAAAGLLVAAAVGGLVLGRARPPGSPVSRRAVDLLEGILVAASVPLALAAMDLFRVAREW
jgi:type VII secretion integral membrane protein EccD